MTRQRDELGPVVRCAQPVQDRDVPADPAPKRLGAGDLVSLPEGERFHEILDGELVRKATPSFEHGDAQSGIVGALKTPFHRPPGRGGPGGWWIKLRIYQSTGVAHDWIVDPLAGTLTVHRWSNDGYVVVLVARRGEIFRAEPFAELELSLSALLGDDLEG
jgi:Uma2 family endonuclease